VTGAPTIRDRVVDAAIAITVQDGWSSVTMARIADAVGVSRQTVYNEVGSKPDLAQAVVLDELDRVLAVVQRAFEAHPRDLRAGVRTAVRGVLEHGADNALVHAIVAGTHGADTDLLPLLTTSSAPLLEAAVEVVAARLAAYRPGSRDVPRASDLVVRVVLSHLMNPTAPPARTASDLAWAVDRLLPT
jgi:AcrR family transcriptional regulator